MRVHMGYLSKSVCLFLVPGQSFGMMVGGSKISGGLGLLSPVSTSTYTHDIRKTERVIDPFRVRRKEFIKRDVTFGFHRGSQNVRKCTQVNGVSTVFLTLLASQANALF